MIKYNLKKIREEKGLTKKELEKLSGVSDTHIGAIERNEREMGLEVLCKLADALDVDIKELFDYIK